MSPRNAAHRRAAREAQDNAHRLLVLLCAAIEADDRKMVRFYGEALDEYLLSNGKPPELTKNQLATLIGAAMYPVGP